MTHFSKIVLLALGFGLLAAVLSLVPSHKVVAAPPTPSLPVNVTNTPLPVQGTVSASQSGAWTVGVSNFPGSQTVNGTVNVGNFPPSAPISFTNTSSTPLYVDTDRAAREPIACPFFTSAGKPAQSCTLPATVSTTMVIESLNVSCLVVSGQTPIGGSPSLSSTAPGAIPQGFFVPIVKTVTDFGGFDYYIWTGPVMQYAVVADGLTFDWDTTDNASSEECTASLTGHFVAP